MDERRLRYAQGVVIAVWLAFAVKLMIADVWDETSGMIAFSSASLSLVQKLHFALTQSLGFWRPLPTMFVATVLHFVTDFDVSWRLLRFVNIAMLIGALAILLRLVHRELRPLLTIAFLFSGGAVITAGWYANIFDASALLMIALSLSLLLRGNDVHAGVIAGIAFFCKESAALVLPFLIVLCAAKHITFKQVLRAAIPATIVGAIYFALRAQVIPFGSASDVHTFAPEMFLPSFVHFAESFWEQTLKSRDLLGFFFLAISFAALRRVQVIAAAIVFFCTTAIIYWGMFNEYQNGVVIKHFNFIGRLYLIPVTLMLLLLALEKQKKVIALLLLPIVFGGVMTWRDHARFQRTYKRIYSHAARTRVKPLTVHYPWKELEDPVRGVRIGNIPNASITIDARTGQLVYR